MTPSQHANPITKWFRITAALAVLVAASLFSAPRAAAQSKSESKAESRADSQAENGGYSDAKAVQLNNEGMQLYQNGKVDEAIAKYRQALERVPKFPEALDNLALALESKGGDDEAITDLLSIPKPPPARRPSLFQSRPGLSP